MPFIRLALAVSLVAGATAFAGDVSAVKRADFLRLASSQFAEVDLDGDGLLHEADFAARAVVSAQLARLNGRVAVAADAATPIGRARTAVLTPGERDMLERRAALEFRFRAGVDGVVDRREWRASREATFDAFDRDGNGVLDGGEIAAFAAAVAEQPAAGAAEASLAAVR